MRYALFDERHAPLYDITGCARDAKAEHRWSDQTGGVGCLTLLKRRRRRYEVLTAEPGSLEEVRRQLRPIKDELVC